MSKYARYDRSPKGRARKARYRLSGREQRLRWMARLAQRIVAKQVRLVALTEELTRG